MLGDLAEEFDIRADYDGAAARRWYYREAWRAAPYLLRNAGRNLRGRDFLGVAGSVVVAAISASVFGRVCFGILWAAGMRPDVMRPVSWFVVPLFVLLNAITPTLGGYVAAWSYKKAPLLAAVTLGVLWAGLDIVNMLRFGELMPPVYRYGAPVIAITFSTIGGLARVWRLSCQPGGLCTRD